MGELTRTYDWSTTSLGIPDQWPQSLRTTLSIILNSKFPMFLFWGPEHLCFYNDAYRPSLGNKGKHPDALGKPGVQVWPEIWAAIKPLIDQVMAGGEATWSEDQLLPIYRNDRMEDVYWTFSYSPVSDESGQPAGVFVTCTETTGQVLARQALEEAENELRSAIELAELGTWTIDVATGIITLSSRHAAWLGLEGSVHSVDTFLACLVKPDRKRIKKALFSTIQPGAASIYFEEYTIVNAQTGQHLIMQATGQAADQPVRIAGTVQDITSQRDLVIALANQVQLQTHDLALTNEELASTMEELAATNEELEAINEEIISSNQAYVKLNEELNTTINLLKRSNESLQRFAYVASHDLQEPLRKIQQFGDLLKTKHATVFGDELVYLDRMQAAAARMSNLIRDLLSFSRLTTETEVRPVSLNQVVEGVMTDLELVIQETRALIKVSPLPTILGDASQLGQLFLNLLSNALKFRRTGVVPIVELRTRLVMRADLPVGLNPSRSTKFYHHLEVIDNGIGFDEQYTQRIFEAFQRLHRKHEYAGTGVGLSISERVVTNHGGAITASSQLGHGAIFSVYLPV